MPPVEFARRASWRTMESRVNVDPVRNQFHVVNVWEVQGASRERLMKAVPHLELSGPYGVYGERTLLKTAVPRSGQNNGRGVEAWAHPTFAPSAMGARARTWPTADGFTASMSEGRLGQGVSRVEIGPTIDGRTRIIERGSYTLSELRTGFAPADALYNLGAATFGRPAVAAAHKFMGELHNKAFNAAEPLVNWVNDHPEPSTQRRR